MSSFSILERVPQITVNAGPSENMWPERLKEELKALIGYTTLLKSSGEEWFSIKPSQNGTRWEGRCWHTYNLKRYEFEFRFSVSLEVPEMSVGRAAASHAAAEKTLTLGFQIPEKYPVTPFELEIPELDGKTLKMYRGGKICLDTHLIPLWSRNCPKFGIVHILALGLAPWLAAEVPFLASACMI